MNDDENMFYSRDVGKLFPKHRPIDSDKSEQKFKALFSTFHLKGQNDKYLNGAKVREIGRFLALIDESNFKLSERLLESKITVPSKVHIYYLNFDRIIEHETNDVDNFFDDIYYPGANDIMIASEKLSWMLYIDHDCHLYEFKANQ